MLRHFPQLRSGRGLEAFLNPCKDENTTTLYCMVRGDKESVFNNHVTQATFTSSKAQAFKTALYLVRSNVFPKRIFALTVACCIHGSYRKWIIKSIEKFLEGKTVIFIQVISPPCLPHLPSTKSRVEIQGTTFQTTSYVVHTHT